MLNSCYMYFITTYARAQAHTHAELFGDKVASKSIDQLQNKNSPSRQDFSTDWQTQSSSPAGEKQSSVSSHRTDCPQGMGTGHHGWEAGREGGPQGLGLLSTAPQERGKEAGADLQGGDVYRKSRLWRER